MNHNTDFLDCHFVHQDKLRHDIKKNTKYTAITITLFWLLILYNSHSGQGQNFHYFIIGVFLAGVAFTMRDGDFIGLLEIECLRRQSCFCYRFQKYIFANKLSGVVVQQCARQKLRLT